MAKAPDSAVYGRPPVELARGEASAVQVSPTVPGSARLEDLSGLSDLLVYAPAGSLERRYVLALALQALAPEGRLTVLAPKDKGGARIRKELQALGFEGEEDARRHHRIVSGRRPRSVGDLQDALAEGAPRLLNSLWTQPGVFSWDRIDPGSAVLAERLPALSGEGADLGSGLGYLARTVLASPAVSRLHLVEIDRRAVEASRRNVQDARAVFHWADATQGPDLAGLDFVVMNPPFHATGIEDRGLGQAFIRRAAGLLRPKGVLWMVANRHLPYEKTLREVFKTVHAVGETGGYKVFEAVK